MPLDQPIILTNGGRWPDVAADTTKISKLKFAKYGKKMNSPSTVDGQNAIPAIAFS